MHTKETFLWALSRAGDSYVPLVYVCWGILFLGERKEFVDIRTGRREERIKTSMHHILVFVVNANNSVVEKASI